ncbi:MAG: helix-turn-helix transcriptional regulator [Dorea formicigenerans]|nr:helix-turn-helix transcriptional regulator [Dorea formicigenerans]
MMDKNKVCTVDDLFALFADVLSPADVLSAKLMGQISSAITKERLDLNLTQKEFASYIDATQSLVSRWERGDYNFSINKIAEIASKLDLDVNITMSHLEQSVSTSSDELETTGKIVQFPTKPNNMYATITEQLEELEEM